MKKILNKIEKTFSAITFAEAGEPEIALELINSFEEKTVHKRNIEKNKGGKFKQNKVSRTIASKLQKA